MSYPTQDPPDKQNQGSPRATSWSFGCPGIRPNLVWLRRHRQHFRPNRHRVKRQKGQASMTDLPTCLSAGRHRAAQVHRRFDFVPYTPMKIARGLKSNCQATFVISAASPTPASASVYDKHKTVYSVDMKNIGCFQRYFSNPPHGICRY